MPCIPVKENTLYALASEVVSVVLVYIPTVVSMTLFLYCYNVVSGSAFTLPFHQSKSKNDGGLAFINNNF